MCMNNLDIQSIKLGEQVLDCGKEKENDLHCHFKLFADKHSLSGQMLKE